MVESSKYPCVASVVKIDAIGATRDTLHALPRDIKINCSLWNRHGNFSNFKVICVWNLASLKWDIINANSTSEIF